jgi:hypothetical protein
MTEKECKITARIEEGLYKQIQEHFYHGQQTLFFRNVFKSLEILIEEERFSQVTDYLYKGTTLTLPAIDKD